jgi:hypothetical protein
VVPAVSWEVVLVLPPQPVVVMEPSAIASKGTLRASLT